jgi:Ni,Fe-hydrogenase I small subunit
MAFRGALSDDENELLARYFEGEITDIQFNYICVTNHYDKEELLRIAEKARNVIAVGKIIVVAVILTFLYICLRLLS